MDALIDAVYENGMLRPLEPLGLSEGQTVKIIVRQTDDDMALRAALGDLVAHWPEPTNLTDEEIEAEIDEVFSPFQGDRPLSEYIIEDRDE